jgi:hypothetical protein
MGGSSGLCFLEGGVWNEGVGDLKETKLTSVLE